MTKLSEIYKALLEQMEMEIDETFEFGICCVIDSMGSRSLSQLETDRLKIHFLDNEPSEDLHKEFFHKRFESAYWWPCQMQHRERRFNQVLDDNYDKLPNLRKSIRFDFIKYLIKEVIKEEDNQLKQ